MFGVKREGSGSRGTGGAGTDNGNARVVPRVPDRNTGRLRQLLLPPQLPRLPQPPDR